MTNVQGQEGGDRAHLEALTDNPLELESRASKSKSNIDRRQGRAELQSRLGR